MADVKKLNGYDIKDETARNGLLTKQDKLTSANAGDNVTIEEVGGVVKISAEAGLPAGEPNSLYGTDGEGNAVAYKAGNGIVLEKVVLPDGYTEVEYIESDWANEAHVEEISTDRITVSCSANSPYIACFDQATSFVGVGQEIVSIKFEGVDFNGYVNWKMHCYTPDGVDHIWYEHESNSGLHNYWLIDVQGDRQVGDYFILERTGWDRRQYIDTGVVLNKILSYDWDKTNGRSYNYAGVNVEINPTAEFDEYMRNGGYIKFKAQNDGMTDNFAYGINGSYTSVASAGWIREHFGIDITGDIIYASYDAAEAVHTVIWLNKSTANPRYIIHTNAYVEDTTNTYLKVLGANNGNNSGIFCNLNGINNYYGWKTFYLSYASLGLPAYKGWNDITIDNTTTQSYGWQQATVNGNSLLQSYTSCYDSSNVLLFTANFSGSVATSGSLKMKRTTIQKDGVIVFDGVPAIRNSDGVAGMYDMANNVFKTSESEGDFVAGPVAVYPRIEIEETEIKNDYDDEVEVVKGFENDEYVQLTWLKSNGSQVIDLGISGAANHEYEISFKCDGLGGSTTGNTRPLFGIYSTTLSQSPGYALKFLNNKLYRVFATGSVGVEQEVCGWDDNWHVVRTRKSYTVIDGVETRNMSPSDDYIDSSWGLFGVKTGSPGNWSFPSPYSYFVGKISYFRDYCSGILVREFVPVRRKSDGQLGFYCIQEDRFCPNVITGYEEGFQGGEIFGTRVIKKNTSNILPGESIYNTIQKQRVNTYGDLAYGYQTSYGSNARPDGPYTTVIGANSNATSSVGYNTVVGANSQTGSYYNTLVGSDSLVSGAESIGLGYHVQAQQNYTIAIGYKSAANGEYSLAIGHRTITGYPHSIEIGDTQSWQNSSIRCVGQYGIAIGDSHRPYRATYSIVMGYSHTIGSTTGGNNTRVISLGYYNTTNGDYDINIGSNTEVSSSYTICLGHQTVIKNNSEHSIAIGSNSIANGNYSMAIGNSAKAGDLSNNYTSSLAIGNSAEALANYGVAIGYQAQSLAQDSIQLGHGTNSEAHSFYVGFTNGSVKMLDSTFVIPYERLTTATPTDGYCLKYDENSDSLVWGEAGGSYTLPIASSSTLGGIKVGSGLTINSSTGVLSANAQVLQPATANRLGGIKVGSGLSVENDGTLSADVQSNNFEDIGGDPYDNQALADALNGLQDNIDGVESDLQGQIDNISSIGEFLAIWDCDTGIARYLNAGFVYPTGGYFIIGSVAAQGQPNYMPDGSTYTGPSTTTTPEDVKVSDMWFYDGTHWIYLANHERQIAVDADLSTTSINPVQNRTITAALDDKQDTLTAGNGIDITDNVISVINNSVGVPQIANVYTKQINGKKSYEEHAQKAEYLLNYSDIMFNLNLNKDQIIEKMDDLYIGVSRYKHNRTSTKVIGQPHLDVSTDSSQITDLAGNITTWMNNWGYDEVNHTFTWISGDDVWEDENGSQYGNLSDFGISYTGTPADGDEIYANFYGMMEVDIRNKIKFNLMNDKYVPLDQKMYCYRFETSDITSSTTDPRHWQYFYIPEDASSWDYEDWVNNDPSLYMFCGHWSPSNYAKCLNALGSTLVFSDIDDGFAPERYEEGDIDRFVVVRKDSIINDGYASLMRCRTYDYNGNKIYAWCVDWDDGGESVYMTQTPTIIPDSYVDTLDDVDTVSSFEADKTFLERRDDLNYWSLQTSNYSVEEFADYLRDCTFNSVYEWFPQADPEKSTTPAWSCYWLDYPIQPVLLRDCEVLTQKTVSDGNRDYERGSWIKLKDLVSKGLTDALEDGMPVQFRYPLNTAEMWLRFGAWQKRCLYNDEYTFYDEEQGQDVTLYTTPALKNSLADCWKIPDEKLLLTKKAFGRQRGSYNAWNQHTKVSEYIQFNLYTPANITMGTQTSSTAVKTKLTINVCYGDSCLRD